MPQCAIAQPASRRAASSNERIASPWLKPWRNASPWLKYVRASGESVVTARLYEPNPSNIGSGPAARVAAPEKITALPTMRHDRGVRYFMPDSLPRGQRNPAVEKQLHPAAYRAQRRVHRRLSLITPSASPPGPRGIARRATGQI